MVERLYGLVLILSIGMSFLMFVNFVLSFRISCF